MAVNMSHLLISLCCASWQYQILWPFVSFPSIFSAKRLFCTFFRFMVLVRYLQQGQKLHFCLECTVLNERNYRKVFFGGKAIAVDTKISFWREIFSSFQNSQYPHSSLVKSHKGPILRIPNVQKEDAGTYVCTASNGVGSMSADQIELLVYCEFFFFYFLSFAQTREKEIYVCYVQNFFQGQRSRIVFTMIKTKEFQIAMAQNDQTTHYVRSSMRRLHQKIWIPRNLMR